MPFICHRCQGNISVTSDGRVGRRELCDKCSSDLHVCKNCKFYSVTSYNECSEPSAERVLDKEKSNFCDYFEFRNSNASATAGEDPKVVARKKLDDLFK